LDSQHENMRFLLLLFQLLYKSWAQADLGELDLEEWVVGNCERIEMLRDSSVLKLNETMRKRKEKWDSKSKDREFQMGEEVLMCKPGLNFKLEESWEGPFVVV